MTLDEGSRAELFQTRTRRGQSLTGALGTSTGVLLHTHIERERERERGGGEGGEIEREREGGERGKR